MADKSVLLLDSFQLDSSKVFKKKLTNCYKMMHILLKMNKPLINFNDILSISITKRLHFEFYFLSYFPLARNYS